MRTGSWVECVQDLALCIVKKCALARGGLLFLSLKMFKMRFVIVVEGRGDEVNVRSQENHMCLQLQLYLRTRSEGILLLTNPPHHSTTIPVLSLIIYLTTCPNPHPLTHVYVGHPTATVLVTTPTLQLFVGLGFSTVSIVTTLFSTLTILSILGARLLKSHGVARGGQLGAAHVGFSVTVVAVTHVGNGTDGAIVGLTGFGGPSGHTHFAQTFVAVLTTGHLGISPSGTSSSTTLTYSGVK
jgi:hypothetical protein